MRYGFSGNSVGMSQGGDVTVAPAEPSASMLTAESEVTA